MAAMFFEICKYPYSLLFPLDRDTVTKFQVNHQRFMRYSFPNLIAPPSGESGQFFLFDQKTMSYTCVLSLVKISHSVQEL